MYVIDHQIGSMPLAIYLLAIFAIIVIVTQAIILLFKGSARISIAVLLIELCLAVIVPFALEIKHSNDAVSGPEAVHEETVDASSDKQQEQDSQKQESEIKIENNNSIDVHVSISGFENVNNKTPISVDTSYSERRLSNTETENAKRKIISLIENIKNNNGYIHVYTGENEYDTYIYNKHGEVFAVGNESTNMTVFRSDDTAIQFTDMIAQTEAIDILTLVLNSLYAIDNNNIEMYESESESNYQEYVAIFDTYDDIRQLYSSASSKYVEYMINDIKEASTKNIVPTFKIYYMVSEGGGLTVACHLVDGEETYLNWYIDGYHNVYDWKLPNEWYTYDFTDAEISENMLTELSGALEEMLIRYAFENNIEVTN